MGLVLSQVRRQPSKAHPEFEDELALQKGIIKSNRIGAIAIYDSVCRLLEGHAVRNS